MLATSFELEQLRAFSLAVESEFAPGGRPKLPDLPLVPDGLKTCCAQYYDCDPTSFCHGTAPIRKVRFIDTKRGRSTLERLCEAVDRNLSQHHETPWELATRRITLALFEVRIPPGGM